MSKRYLRQLRADMARVENLSILTHGITLERFGYRIWPDRGTVVAEAFLAGLERAERKAGVPVYGLLLDARPDDHDGERPENPFTRAYRVRDRALIAAGRFSAVVTAVIADAAGEAAEGMTT
jgi:hypothetical protein